MAKDLRRSSERYVVENVYINPDLSPVEAKAAYERRQRRRATASTGRQQSQVPPADLTTDSLNSCTASSAIADAQYNTPSTDEVASGSSTTATTTATTTSITLSSSVLTGTDMSTVVTNQPFLLDK